MKRNSTFMPNWYEGFLYLCILSAVFLTVAVALNKDFDRDEFEHIHAAWYMANGNLPYQDYFEHHHPLFWVMLLPYIQLGGESITTVLCLRILMALVVFLIASLSFHLAKEVTASKDTALLAVVLLFSVQLFLAEAVEIRPDVPQLLFSLLSFVYFLKGLRRKRRQDFLMSAVYWFIAFLFLQKALLFLPVYAIIFFYKRWHDQVSIISEILFGLGIVIPLYLAWHVLKTTGLWEDYWLLNWVLNVEKVKEFLPVTALHRTLETNTLFWICIVGALSGLLLRRIKGETVLVTALVGIYLFVLVIFLPKPYPHYFLFAFPFLATVAAVFLKSVFERFHLGNLVRILVVLLVFSNGIYFIADKQLSVERKDRQIRQLGRIDYVLRHSKRFEMVFDSNAEFNLFRPDLHYFWFSLGARSQNRVIYNQQTNNRYSDYDPCRLVRTKRPIIVSDQVDLTACGLSDDYRSTPFKGLYIREAPN